MPDKPVPDFTATSKNPPKLFRSNLVERLAILLVTQIDCQPFLKVVSVLPSGIRTFFKADFCLDFKFSLPHGAAIHNFSTTGETVSNFRFLASPIRVYSINKRFPLKNWYPRGSREMSEQQFESQDC
jgi:hypothetical protein